MKVLYAGTPELAVAPLDALLEAGHNVVAVLTRTDAPVGRKKVLTPSPVAQRAQELNLPVIKADRWDEATHTAVAATGAEVAAVVAFGVLLPQRALNTLPYGWINLHFSALPAWRGAAPVQRALMAGEREIFSNTFRIEVGLDTGPVFRQESTPVGELDTAGDILKRLATSGGALLSATFADIAEGATGQPQIGQATHAAKLSILDGKLDFTRSADELLAQVRGVTPEPGAWAELDGARFKIGMVCHAEAPALGLPGTVHLAGKKPVVTCGDGCLELIQVQPAGKKMMNAADWARGQSAAIANQKVVLV